MGSMGIRGDHRAGWSSATAHQDWDRRWSDSQQHAGWQHPEPLIQASVPLLRARRLHRVLDLGCGIGRHAHFLAGEGFRCSGVDASPAGIAHAREQAAAVGLSIDYQLGEFHDVPFADHSLDCVIAWNVIYHGDSRVVRRVLDEIRRVLVPGGIYLGTMLSKRNVMYGRGQEVSTDTFVIHDATSDKAHPHFYCDTAALVDLHHGFEIVELRDREQQPGAYHWEFLMERRTLSTPPHR
jgi:tellurite methyltransferase